MKGMAVWLLVWLLLVVLRLKLDNNLNCFFILLISLAAHKQSPVTADGWALHDWREIYP
jgi:hypothetical protein